MIVGWQLFSSFQWFAQAELPGVGVQRVAAALPLGAAFRTTGDRRNDDQWVGGDLEPVNFELNFDETLPDGKLIPAGAGLIIAPYFMSRDPEIWKDPLKFIPERFDVETTAEKMNPYAYIPFSAGSRNCIGQKFAMLEIKSTVSKVLRHYQLSIDDGFEPQESLEIVIKSQNGVMIKLNKRVY